MICHRKQGRIEMTSAEARERVAQHLVGRGYSRRDAGKHIYLLDPDGVHRWDLVGSKARPQRRSGPGWETFGPDICLICSLQQLDAEKAEADARNR
jgi:hypothetical protein